MSKKATDQRSNFLRLAILLLDEGLPVLRWIFDNKHSPGRLHTDLANAKPELEKFYKKKALNQEQWNVLYPPTGGQVNSISLDFSLLTFLLTFPSTVRYLPAGWSCLPSQQKEDVVKLRDYRNKMAHCTHGASIPDEEFERDWKRIQKILLRNGKGNNDLRQRISELKSGSLDPGLEAEYHQLLQELCMKDEQLTDQQNKIEILNTRNLELIASKAENSAIWPDDFEDKRETFVKTVIFRKAESVLTSKKILVLTGNPGEGKTTIAAHLLNRHFSPDRCLIIREPEGWTCFDPKVYEVVLIEDIFGPQMNSSKLDFWKPRMKQIANLTKRCDVSFIITTRSHVLEDCLDDLRSTNVFSEQHIVDVSSVQLSAADKVLILQKHLDFAGIQISLEVIEDCVSKHSSKSVVGFPACAELFSSKYGPTDRFVAHELGPNFFQKPLMFLQSSLSELLAYDEDQFFAFVLLWISPAISDSELKHPDSLSGTLKRIASVYSRTLDMKMIRLIRSTLRKYNDCFVEFSERSGNYRLRSGIGDMIGLLYSRRYPEETLQLCSFDFIMEYVKLDDEFISDREFTFKLKQHLYPVLVRRFIDNMRSDTPLMIDAYHDSDDEDPEVSSFRCSFKMWSSLHTEDIFVIARHTAVHNVTFVRALLSNVEQDNLHDLFWGTYNKGIRPVYAKCAFESWSTLTLIPFCLQIKDRKEILVREVLQRKYLDRLSNGEVARESKEATLLFAIANKCHEIISILLEPELVNRKTVRLAILTGECELTKHLLEVGNFDVNVNLFCGNTPLILASKCGHLDIVKHLICKGARLNVRNDKNFTALHKAVINKNEDVASELVHAGADIHARGGRRKKSAIHFAAEFGLPKTVQILLTKGVSCVAKDRRGHTALHYAAMFNKCGVAEIILETYPQAVDIKAFSCGKRSKIRGTTPLYYAARQGNEKMIDVLLRYGASVTITNSYGETPLFIAASYGHTEVADKLILRGSNMAQRNSRGYTALHTAVYRKHLKAVEYLMGKVDINAADMHGKTPLHVAAQHGYSEILQLLLLNGADCSRKTEKGDYALHFACTNGDKKMVSFLLERDKEIVYRENLKGKTPLSEAKRYQFRQNSIDDLADEKPFLHIHLLVTYYNAFGYLKYPGWLGTDDRDENILDMMKRLGVDL